MNYLLLPFKGMGIMDVGLGEGIDGAAHMPRRGGAQPSKGLSSQCAEPALYLVQARSMGGHVVEMDVRMPRQLSIVFGLVSVEVIQDDMQFSVWIAGHNAVHEVKEFAALNQ